VLHCDLYIACYFVSMDAIYMIVYLCGMLTLIMMSDCIYIFVQIRHLGLLPRTIPSYIICTCF